MDQDTISKIVESAVRAMEHAYGLNDLDNRYGAAALGSNGAIYSSGQYRTASLTLTVHAEFGALIHAAAHGVHTVVALAVVSNRDIDPAINPCGMCKQVIRESSLASGVDIEVVRASLSGEVDIRPISTFDPFPWP